VGPDTYAKLATGPRPPFGLTDVPPMLLAMLGGGYVRFLPQMIERDGDTMPVLNLTDDGRALLAKLRELETEHMVASLA
jgi:hypothetical protein